MSDVCELMYDYVMAKQKRDEAQDNCRTSWDFQGPEDQAVKLAERRALEALTEFVLMVYEKGK